MNAIALNKFLPPFLEEQIRNSRQPFGTLHSGSALGAPNTEYAVSLGCTSLHPYLLVMAHSVCYYITSKHRIFWNVKRNKFLSFLLVYPRI